MMSRSRFASLLPLCQSTEPYSGFPSSGAPGVCYAAYVRPPGPAWGLSSELTAGAGCSRDVLLARRDTRSEYTPAQSRGPGALSRENGSSPTKEKQGTSHQHSVPVRRRGWHAWEVSVAVLDDISHGRTVSICGLRSYPAPGRQVAAKAGPVYVKRAAVSRQRRRAQEDKNSFVMISTFIPDIIFVIFCEKFPISPCSSKSQTVF